ncbi:T-cell surface glycoprotein CD3 zeta chain-like [Pempheris klunzingeri]|uniref:T-cell surface glycoprotein CD3 zeta chain-like n=1 Tax=Pempheris klunzingeri TaxID=3127111 RepID=UPI00397EE285
MAVLRTGVFVLLVPAVSCLEGLFSAPVTCYLLDGILIIYCICATAFFFREKFSYNSSEAVGASTKQEGDGGIYQELDRPKDADAYQVLEPLKKKKKVVKKKKSESAQAEQTDKDPSTSAPPTSPK